MKLRATLAIRLRALMDDRIDLNTQTKVASRAGVGQATVQRILTQQAGATVDSVDALAAAFRVSPVELLLDDGDAQLLSAWARLDPEDKARVLHYIELSATAPKSHAPAPKRLDFEERKPVPTLMAAAAARASARRPTTDPTQNATGHEKTHQRPRKRPRA